MVRVQNKFQDVGYIPGNTIERFLQVKMGLSVWCNMQVLQRTFYLPFLTYLRIYSISFVILAAFKPLYSKVRGGNF